MCNIYHTSNQYNVPVSASTITNLGQMSKFFKKCLITYIVYTYSTADMYYLCRIYCINKYMYLEIHTSWTLNALGSLPYYINKKKFLNNLIIKNSSFAFPLLNHRMAPWLCGHGWWWQLSRQKFCSLSRELWRIWRLWLLSG